MRLFSFRHTSVWAVSALCAAPAFAATQTQSSQFNFAVSPNPDVADCYEGTDALSFNPFDTQGGTRSLDNVTLSLDMNISGTLNVSTPGLDRVAPLEQDDEDAIEISLTGTAGAGPASATDSVLTTEAVFSPVENAGQSFFVNIDEDGSGDHFTTQNIGAFAGDEPIDVRLFAEAMVVYNTVGQIGAVETLSATGNVKLAYGYSPTGAPPPSVPTPAALGGGLMLLAGLGLRRRRRV